MKRGRATHLTARRVDDHMHPTLSDGVLVAPADAHRHADDPELRVPESERHRSQRTFGAALDVAMATDEVLTELADRHRGAA